jgi:nickel superoxide dismutase
MKKTLKLLVPAPFLLLLFISTAAAHCEIPCGIYDDELRAKLIAEHATTIEKSMRQIAKIKNSNPVDYNQLVRWVTNKEAHADKVQHIVTQYFLTQRIKPGQKDYADKLAVLHQLLIDAMKCKQTTDPAHVQSLRTHLRAFEKMYFGHHDN